MVSPGITPADTSDSGTMVSPGITPADTSDSGTMVSPGITPAAGVGWLRKLADLPADMQQCSWGLVRSSHGPLPTPPATSQLLATSSDA